MNYRSIAQLSRCISGNLHRLPLDLDLVVGVPRSGLLAANLFALGLNLKLTDLRGFLDNAPLPSPNLRSVRYPTLARPQEAQHVLMVEDSVLSGGTLQQIRAQIAGIAKAPRITYCAVYATAKSQGFVDIALELVPPPRAFEWNLMHRDLLQQCCVDIDGVLCPDPDAKHNDDGKHYQHFMASTPCLIRPTSPIAHLVTARLERYRPHTERWLASNGVRYGHLHMLNMPDAESRRRSSAHSSFKASVYRRQHDTVLFIESDPLQAQQIAQLSGKPVLCHTTQEMAYPGMSTASLEAKGRQFATGIFNRMHRLVRRIGNGR